MVPTFSYRAQLLSVLSCIYILTTISFHWSTTMRRTMAYGRLRNDYQPCMSKTELAPLGEVSLKLVSFNVLAPCYKKVKVTDDSHVLMESDFEDSYLDRNRMICEELVKTDADVICLQEYWSESPKLRKLYWETLCGPCGAGYKMRELRRTSHWRTRQDGLAVFIKESRVALQDARDILFHDCGDRVAQMLLLAMKPPEGAPPSFPAQQFICVNTHLLFPHNEDSSKIRVREMTKILGYVESYRMKELSNTVCGRADVRVPILIAGDFNGPPKGSVYSFAKKQNYKSAFEEYCRLKPTVKRSTATPPGFACSLATSKVDADDHKLEHHDYYNDKEVVQHNEYDGSHSDHHHEHSGDEDRWHMLDDESQDLIATPADTDELVEKISDYDAFDAFDQRWHSWISHRSHLKTHVPVDHVFFLNPSDQAEEKLPPIPDWTNLVFTEIIQKFVTVYGTTTMFDIFRALDTDQSNTISLQEFEETLNNLGFVGEGKSALTPDEIKVIIDSFDADGNGLIDFKEFSERFWLAVNYGEKRTQQPFRYRLGKSAVFARSNWLTEKFTQSQSSYPDGERESSPFFEPPLPAETLDILNARPMGDLTVKSAKLIPEDLEKGIWPDNYTLSDHGMVEVVFSGQALPAEAPDTEDLIAFEGSAGSTDPPTDHIALTQGDSTGETRLLDSSSSGTGAAVLHGGAGSESIAMVSSPSSSWGDRLPTVLPFRPSRLNETFVRDIMNSAGTQIL